MRQTRKITISLTKEEVKSAILAYLLASDKTELTHIDNIDSITERIEIPGIDPHDCDYREEFAGIEVTGS